MPSRKVVDRDARVARFDDREGGFGFEVLDERVDDLLRQIFLKKETMGECVDETSNPAKSWDSIVRKERDVRFSLGGHQVMGTHEHQRDARRDDGPAAL